MFQRLGEACSRLFLRGIPLGRAFGIPVRMNPLTLAPLVVWLEFARRADRPWATALEVSIYFGAMLLSVLLHELGHCYGGRLVGARADHILLWPLGGLAWIEGATRSPHDEFVVTLFGPLVSLALAAFSALVAALLPGSSAAWEHLAQGSWAAQAYAFLGVFWVKMAAYNTILFVFNMIVPLFPMDCARLIRSWVSMRRNPEQTTYYLCLAGLIVGGFFFGLSISDNFLAKPDANIFLAMIAVFGIWSCFAEMRSIELRYVYTDPIAGAAQFSELLRRIRAVRQAWRDARRLGHRRPANVIDVASPEEYPIAEVEAEGQSELAALQAELQRAVDGEDFVQAARLRDRIKKLRAETPKA